jgi:predicted alpha/beta-fold hydrolase
MKNSTTFSVAFTSDLKLAIDKIHQKYPESPIIAVALSYSASILTKYLSEVGSETPVIAAMTVANPFDFVGLSKHFETIRMKTTYNKCN